MWSRHWVSMAIAAMASFTSIIAAAGTELSPVAKLIEESELQILAADFAAADKTLDDALAATSDPAETLLIRLQRLRLERSARISGLPFPEEDETIEEVDRLAGTQKDSELRGLSRLGAAKSRYFRILTSGEMQPAAALIGEFERSAKEIKALCPRSNAMFFAALIPQVLGKVRESKKDLQEAWALASKGKCLEELAFIDRHLAAVAEESGDIEAARALNARSVALRREIGTSVYLPFALIYQAELDAMAGDASRAAASLREALEISGARSLPAQKKSACRAAARLKFDLPGC